MPSDREDQARYYAGTLAYTRAALTRLVLWLLLSNFCFMLKEAALPNVATIVFKARGLTNAQIGTLVGSVPALLILLINPTLSCRSDRHRGRWGRRIPFLAVTAPCVGLCTILAAFHVEAGRWLHTLLPAAFSESVAVTFYLAACLVVFEAFNAAFGAVYGLLFNDVVPQCWLGRFFGLFRMAGSAGTFCFSLFLLGKLETHAREVLLFVGVVFTAVFALVCWRVREGEYSAPAPRDPGPKGTSAIRGYFTECFGDPLYVWLFVGVAASTCAYLGVNLFSLFLAQEVGLSLAAFGKILAGVHLAAFCLSVPLGYLADRVSPLRLAVWTALFACLLAAVSFLAVRGPRSFAVCATLVGVGFAFWIASLHPLFPALLPKDRYGQFVSANILLSSIATVVGAYLAGKFIDFAGGSYRYIYLWNAVFCGLALIALLQVRIRTKRPDSRSTARATSPVSNTAATTIGSVEPDISGSAR